MATDPKIDKRDDTHPAAGEPTYGDVQFADPTNKKYPIDTPEHVRPGWRSNCPELYSYIHQANAANYEAYEVKVIKDRIHKAARQQGVALLEG